MNKETRQFIWGILLTIIGSVAVALWIIDIKNGTHMDWFSWLCFIGSILAMAGGLKYINNSI